MSLSGDRSPPRSTVSRIGKSRYYGANARRRNTGAVAADEADIVAQRQQFIDDRLDQGGVVAAGNVAAPDRAVEQHVANVGNAQDVVTSGARFGMTGVRDFAPDRWLEEGQQVTIGDLTFDILHCPGHSPGSVAWQA
jgi:hydroxyacylglutathione hydrolase